MNEWVFFEYPLDTKPHIIAHACNPYVAEARREDVKARYGIEPVKTFRSDTVHFDLGGMMRTNEPVITIPVGAGRNFQCLAFQAVDIAEALRGASTHYLGKSRWYRVTSFPGRMIYLSARDRNRILVHLDDVADPDFAKKHRDEMMMALAKANKFGRHPDMN